MGGLRKRAGREREHLIDVNLSTQLLVASCGGEVFLSSPITSGKAGFRTPKGRFRTSVKLRDDWTESPYAEGPGYFVPRVLRYAIGFGGEYYLHTWEHPDLADFGPGSQDGPYASVGCILAPDEVMAALYSWAPRGTAVYIHD